MWHSFIIYSTHRFLNVISNITVIFSDIPILLCHSLSYVLCLCVVTLFIYLIIMWQGLPVCAACLKALHILWNQLCAVVTGTTTLVKAICYMLYEIFITPPHHDQHTQDRTCLTLWNYTSLSHFSKDSQHNKVKALNIIPTVQWTHFSFFFFLSCLSAFK